MYRRLGAVLFLYSALYGMDHNQLALSEESKQDCIDHALLDTLRADLPPEMRYYIAQYEQHGADETKVLVGKAMQKTEVKFAKGNGLIWFVTPADYDDVMVINQDETKKTIICAHPSFYDYGDVEIFDAKTGESQGVCDITHINGAKDYLESILDSATSYFYFEHDEKEYYVALSRKKHILQMKLLNEDHKIVIGESRQTCMEGGLILAGVYANHENEYSFLSVSYDTIKKWDLAQVLKIYYALQKDIRPYQVEFLKLLHPYMIVTRKNWWGNEYHPKLKLNSKDHSLALETLDSFNNEVRALLMDYIEIEESFREKMQNWVINYTE